MKNKIYTVYIFYMHFANLIKQQTSLTLQSTNQYTFKDLFPKAHCP